VKHHRYSSDLNHSAQLERVKNLFICSLSTLVLFSGFFFNSCQVANQRWFVDQPKYVDSHIAGRLMKSHQDGVFSAGGLIGFGSSSQSSLTDPDEVASFQYYAYINDLRFDAYWPYQSQIGAQGTLFSLLDTVVPLPPLLKLEFFYAFTSVLSALALALVIMWFDLEFGFTVALVVLVSTFFSQWLTAFGRSLYWSMWGFYLPMLAVMYFLRRDIAPTRHHFVQFGILVFIALFAKFLVNGYEYITTTLIMTMVPFAYYSILHSWTFRRILMGVFAATVGSLLAILLSVGVLCFQVASIKGNLLDGVTHIVYSMQKRTHAADARGFPMAVRSSLESNVGDVVWTYFKGTYLDLNNYVSSSSIVVSERLFKIRYLYLIVLFFVMTLLVLRRRSGNVSLTQRQGAAALTVATWISILAPTSWYVVFKAHSHMHDGYNFIVWQMPFTIFGFAVCGLAARNALLDFIDRTRHSRVAAIQTTAVNR